MERLKCLIIGGVFVLMGIHGISEIPILGIIFAVLGLGFIVFAIKYCSWDS